MDKLKKVILVLIILIEILGVSVIILICNQKKHNTSENVANQENLYEQTLQTTMNSRFCKSRRLLYILYSKRYYR